MDQGSGPATAGGNERRLEFTCECGKSYRAPLKRAGTQFRCRRCKAVVQVPLATPMAVHQPPSEEIFVGEVLIDDASEAMVVTDILPEDNAATEPPIAQALPGFDTTDAFNGLPENFDGLPDGFNGLPDFAAETPSPVAASFASLPGAGPVTGAGPVSSVASPAQPIDRRIQGDHLNVGETLSRVTGELGPWQDANYTVTQGSTPMPRRCVVSDADGDVEYRESYRIYPFYLRVIIVSLSFCFGLFGGLVGVWIVNAVVGREGYDEETVRFWVSKRWHRIFETARYACYTLAGIGTLMLFAGIWMAFSNMFDAQELPSGLSQMGIGADGQRIDETREDSGASPWLLPLSGFLLMSLAGLASPFTRPLWAHRIDSKNQFVWLSGVHPDFRKRFGKLKTTQSPPLPIYAQHLLAVTPIGIVLSCFMLFAIFRVVSAGVELDGITSNPTAMFEMPAPRSGFPAPAKPRRAGQADRYSINLGIDPPTPGWADELSILVPTEGPDKTELPAKLPCVFIAFPSDAPITGSNSNGYPIPSAREFVRHGWIAVSYQSDGYVPFFNKRSELVAGSMAHIRSLGGLINGQNAVTYLTEHFPVDEERMYFFGEGHSGSIALSMAVHDPRIDGAVVIAPKIHLNDAAGQQWHEVSPLVEPFLIRASPITHAEQLRVPLTVFQKPESPEFTQLEDYLSKMGKVNSDVTLITDLGDDLRLTKRRAAQWLADHLATQNNATNQ
ncbi:MAG: hypothetical protein AAF958_04605 [Planctomycetota bacterium]